MRISRLACTVAVAATVAALAASAADRSAPRARKKADPARSMPANPPAQPDLPPVPRAPVVTPAAPAVPQMAPTMTMTPSMPAPALPAGPAGKAEIVELVHDAGDVERGTDIVHAFQIKSIGANPLTVDAKPGCGCTVTDYDKIVAPGTTGRLTATVHTTNFKGAISKSITVITNDPENSRVTLTIKANVQVPVDVQPSENLAFNGRSESLSPQQVTVTSVDGSAFDVTGVTAADPGFTVKVDALTDSGAAPKVKPGTVASGSSKYRVTVSPSKSIAVGRVSSSILLKTTHPKAADITLRIFGTVTGDVEVVPPHITLSTGSTASPEAKVQHAVIKKTTGDPLQILAVTSDNPLVVTTLKTVTEGREYDLEIKYTGEPMTTALASRVNVRTNDPKQPSLDLQVWGRVDQGMRAPQAAATPVTMRPAQAQAPPTP